MFKTSRVQAESLEGVPLRLGRSQEEGERELHKKFWSHFALYKKYLFLRFFPRKLLRVALD